MLQIFILTRRGFSTKWKLREENRTKDSSIEVYKEGEEDEPAGPIW